jgi:hypothetical protein
MSKFREIWLPGIIFMFAGAALGWWISRTDTKTQIDGIARANAQLQSDNGELSYQKGALEMQITMLRHQKSTLDGLVKELAATHRDIRLIFDAQGNLLGGQIVTNSEGKAILDSSGRKIRNSQPRPR